MKTILNIRKTMFSVLATGLITCSLLVACDKDDDDMNDDDMYSISGNASGSQEIPTNASTGTATLTGTYNSRTNLLNYTINWTGLTNMLTVAHFHGPATATETAGPLVDITIGTNGASGTTTGTATLTETVESHLLAGKLYFNLHTALYPNGEVRGQVAVTAQ